MGGVVNIVRERRKYYFSVERIRHLPIHISNVANVCSLLKYRYLLLNNASNLKYSEHAYDKKGMYSKKTYVLNSENSSL